MIFSSLEMWFTIWSVSLPLKGNWRFLSFLSFINKLINKFQGEQFCYDRPFFQRLCSWECLNYAGQQPVLLLLRKQYRNWWTEGEWKKLSHCLKNTALLLGHLGKDEIIDYLRDNYDDTVVDKTTGSRTFPVDAYCTNVYYIQYIRYCHVGNECRFSELVIICNFDCLHKNSLNLIATRIIKNIFNKNERKCRDLKTQKACKQGWEANIGHKITSI